MAKQTIPESVVVTCDICGLSNVQANIQRDARRQVCGSHLTLMLDPRVGLGGDKREADLCTACADKVLEALQVIGLSFPPRVLARGAARG